MKTAPLVVERTVDAPLEKVWKAITDKHDMKQWYFDLSDFKPEVGFEFQFVGYGPDGCKYIHLCRITELIPKSRLTYSWQYEGEEGLSFVTFELFAEGAGTRVKLTH